MSQQLAISFDRPRNDRESQSAAILSYLQQGHALTQLDGLRLFKCLRIGARIWDLKKQGYKIESQMVKVPSGKRVAQYRLVGD